MKQQIKHLLSEIEARYKVKILLACEGGSRAFGTASLDSDFDVRFIYLPSPEWYLAIDQKRDVIEIADHPKLEFHGWELTKALRLFRKSNPPLFEWLDSPIGYLGDSFFKEKIKELEIKAFNPVVFLNHYLNMAKRNIKQELSQEQIKVKGYFNIIRPILVCTWYMKYHSRPVVTIDSLLTQFEEASPIKKEIMELVAIKKEARLSMVSPRYVLNQFFSEEIKRIEGYLTHQTPNSISITEELDALFRELLKEFWNLKI